MKGFGEQLREERETRGFTLRQVSEETKIGVSHLQALEKEDLARLPGGVFNRGYVRTYAEFLGQNAGALVDLYIQEERRQVAAGTLDAPDVLQELSRTIDARRERSDGGRRGLAWTVLVVVLAAGAVGTWWSLVRDDATEPLTASTTTDSVTPRPVQRSMPPAGPTSPEVESTAPEAAPVDREVEPGPVVAQPPEAPAEPETPQTPAAGSSMRIPDYGVGTGIENRSLVGRSDRFDNGSEVWFWTRVLDGSPDDRIRHVWMHEGQVVSSIELRVGASHWRTQSRRIVTETGSWAVEARDAGGTLLAGLSFIVE